LETLKPKTIDKYKMWLASDHDVDVSDINENYYDMVSWRIKEDFEKSELWIKIIDSLREFDQEYELNNGYKLFISGFEPKISIKSFDSFLLKSYRKNIIENNNFPVEPEFGWILPKNWFIKINDIVRTLFVVKYLDGVEFLIEKISSLSKNFNKECKVFYEAREEGYYAAHIYIIHGVEIPKMNWDTERINASIEIQITTQLQEVIRKLLHIYYEKRRKIMEIEDIKWQWNYKSDEFIANYLGHILHYVEGMIMEIREKQKGEKI